MAREPFDLAAGPLLRAAVLRFAEGTHVIALVVHHIVFDRWSFGVLIGELATLYRTMQSGEPPALVPLRTGYGECSRAELNDTKRTNGALAYWHALLADRETLELPADRARPANPSGCGATVVMTLPAEYAVPIVRRGTARGATRS